MSQGTRVHQMAMYTLFEAPLQMLADSPSKYMKEQECTDFIAKVPTVFDETVALDGEVGEYLTLARRKGDVWYIASMTDWTPRDCTIDLSFLGEGSYEAEIFSDGINADRLQERSTHRDLGRQAEHTHGTRRRMDSTDMEKMIG
jgi:alpha-glucosidase